MSNNMIKDNKDTRTFSPMTIFDFFNRPITDFDFFKGKNGFDNFKVDIKDVGDAYEIKADMPGVNKEDIKLDYEDNVFTISATHHSNKEETDENGYVVRERQEGTYKRSFAIDDIDEQNIEASFDQGVLEVKMVKKQKKEKKYIAIK